MNANVNAQQRPQDTCNPEWITDWITEFGNQQGAPTFEAALITQLQLLDYQGFDNSANGLQAFPQVLNLLADQDLGNTGFEEPQAIGRGDEVSAL